MAFYMRVTIHDNDFSDCLEATCERLHTAFHYEYSVPHDETSIDIEGLKYFIAKMMAANHILCHIMEDKEPYSLEVENHHVKYFLEHLQIEFVDEMLDWDNRESCYIPLWSENAFVVTR